MKCCILSVYIYVIALKSHFTFIKISKTTLIIFFFLSLWYIYILFFAQFHKMFKLAKICYFFPLISINIRISLLLCKSPFKKVKNYGHFPLYSMRNICSILDESTFDVLHGKIHSRLIWLIHQRLNYSIIYKLYQGKKIQTPEK